METASIPAATLRAPLDRPLHRLYVGQTDTSPYTQAVFACFPHPSVFLHGPLQSRPLGRKEQVDYKFGSKELTGLKSSLYCVEQNLRPFPGLTDATTPPENILSDHTNTKLQILL